MRFYGHWADGVDPLEGDFGRDPTFDHEAQDGHA
jgi:hypothetical protein